MAARSRSRRSPAVHPLVFLVALTAILLVPVFAAAAQSDPIRTSPTETPEPPPGPGNIQGAVTEEPDPMPPTEEPSASTPDDITTTEVPAAPSTLTLHKRACDDPTFDPLTAQGLDTFLDACPSPEGEFEFIVTGMNGFQSTQQTTSGAFTIEVPVGLIVITETILPGWADPAVFCSSNLFPAASPQPYLGNGPSWNVATEEHVECWWFNIAINTGTPATDDGPDILLDPGLQEGQAEVLEHDVTLTKRTCPAGTDPTLTLDAYQNLCPTTADVEFQIEYGAGATSTTTTNANGELTWMGIADGPFEIHETNHAAYALQIAFCHYDGIGAPWQPNIIQGTFLGTFDQDLPPGTGHVHLICDWINIESDTTATVRIIKHRCPLGVPEDQTLDQYVVICPDLFDGVQFTLDHPGGSFPGETANGGQLEWTDVPAGPIILTETNPGGYKEPRVFCHFFSGAHEQLAGQEEQSFIGIIPLIVPHEATEVVCWIINIPNPENSILVHKWLCPVGFDQQTDDHYAECTEPMDGVTFTLDNGDQATTGDSGPGMAYFPDLPAGQYVLAEVLPPGISHGWVDICYHNSGQGFIPLALVGDDVPSVGLDVDTGDHWDCHIYNIPEPEENSITIRKWQCPDSTPLDQSREWYEANCLAHHDGVLFSIASGLGIAAAPTMGGAVHVDTLPGGDIGIQEQIPDGFGPPLVFCNTDGNWQSYPAPTGHWSHTFPNDGVNDLLVCYVYNIPGEDPDLTILKWTCPEGYDLNAAGADPYTDCTQATNGVEFELRLSGQANLEQSQVTGDVIDGGVIFENLPPDLYHVTEIVPAGIDSAFVLECTGHVLGQLQPYPLAMGNVLDHIDLDAGEHLVCHWFNVPETDGGSLVVFKYTCATETFISEVECQIEEDGVTFSLLHWNPGTGQWDEIDTGNTGPTGHVTWNPLEAGDYRIEEHGGDWCHLESTPAAGPGDEITVTDGNETVVKVYNCDSIPGIPGETPTKYPNTGVQREVVPSVFPGRTHGQYPLAA